MERGPAVELPFELVLRDNASWRGYWREPKLGIEVAGTQDAPIAPLLDTLRDVIARWSEVQQTIAAFVRALASDEHVPLQPATIGGFAARTCRFDQELYFSSISVTDASSPQRVHVTFYTGYPDGYATFEIVLDGGAPSSISAFAS
jgi:hypothetical protein